MNVSGCRHELHLAHSSQLASSGMEAVVAGCRSEIIGTELFDSKVLGGLEATAQQSVIGVAGDKDDTHGKTPGLHHVASFALAEGLQVARPEFRCWSVLVFFIFLNSSPCSLQWKKMEIKHKK